MLRSLFRTPDVEERALQVQPWGSWDGGQTYPFDYSISAGQSPLLTVFACVSLISDTIATLPIHCYRKDAAIGGNRTEVPTPSWLQQPNENANIIEFITQTMWSLLLDGNAYWAYGLNNAFGLQTLNILDPTQMTIDTSSGDVVYRYKGQPFTGRMRHIRGIMRPGSIKGVSPVEAARQTLALALSAETFAKKFYDNSAQPSIAVTVPGKLTPDQARDVKEKVSRSNGGLHNAHLPMVIDNGGDIKTLSLTMEQSQFLETRNFQQAQISSQMFLLDPTWFDISTGRGQNLTYANLEQRGEHLVTYTLARWLIRLEEAFSKLLPNPQYMKFNVDALKRADLKTRYEAYRIANPTVAWESGQEIRDLEDMGPMPADLKTQNKPAPVPAMQTFPTPAQSQPTSNGVGANQ